MNDETKLIEVGSKVWEFRKANGFSKKLSPEIQAEIAQLCQSSKKLASKKQRQKREP